VLPTSDMGLSASPAAAGHGVEGAGAVWRAWVRWELVSRRLGAGRRPRRRHGQVRPRLRNALHARAQVHLPAIPRASGPPRMKSGLIVSAAHRAARRIAQAESARGGRPASIPHARITSMCTGYNPPSNRDRNDPSRRALLRYLRTRMSRRVAARRWL